MKNNQLDIYSLLEKPKEVKDKELPKNLKLSPDTLWCPYCSTAVVFKKDKKLGVKKCPICGVSNREYWVKKVNKCL